MPLFSFACIRLYSVLLTRSAHSTSHLQHREEYFASILDCHVLHQLLQQMRMLHLLPDWAAVDVHGLSSHMKHGLSSHVVRAVSAVSR